MPYCPKCGAEVSEEDKYCVRCGAPLKVSEGRPRHYKEKYEKREKEEKEEKYEKREEDGKISSIIGGLILIWLGITFFLAEYDYISWSIWWAYFISGLGCILILRAIIVASVKSKKLRLESLVGGIVLFVIGAAFILGVKEWWPIILLALGVIIVIKGLIERSRSPKPLKEPLE